MCIDVTVDGTADVDVGVAGRVTVTDNVTYGGGVAVVVVVVVLFFVLLLLVVLVFMLVLRLLWCWSLGC